MVVPVYAVVAVRAAQEVYAGVAVVGGGGGAVYLNLLVVIVL